MRATRLLAAIVLLALAACTAAPSPSNGGGAELAVPGSDPSSVPPSPSPTSAAIGSMAPGGGSIDPSIEPVSLSAPSADARSAMDACYADAIGLDRSMGSDRSHTRAMLPSTLHFTKGTRSSRRTRRRGSSRSVVASPFLEVSAGPTASSVSSSTIGRPSSWSVIMAAATSRLTSHLHQSPPLTLPAPLP